MVLRATIQLPRQQAIQFGRNGTGYFLATGFDQTPGSWNLSAQLETGQVTATYSASSIVVPEPGSLALIGLGLLGLGFVGRRKA